MAWCMRNLVRDIASAAALGGVGDILCQVIAERRKVPPSLSDLRWRKTGEQPDESTFDPRRCTALTAFNGAYIGGFLHFLYQVYPLVMRKAARATPLPLQAKLMDTRSSAHALGIAGVDSVHNGAVYIPTFFIGTGLLQGDALSEATAVLNREWRETYLWCSAFWVPFTFANFALVPPAGRVRAMAAANLGWALAIDYLAHRG